MRILYNVGEARDVKFQKGELEDKQKSLTGSPEALSSVSAYFRRADCTSQRKGRGRSVQPPEQDNAGETFGEAVEESSLCCA